LRRAKDIVLRHDYAQSIRQRLCRGSSLSLVTEENFCHGPKLSSSLLGQRRTPSPPAQRAHGREARALVCELARSVPKSTQKFWQSRQAAKVASEGTAHAQNVTRAVGFRPRLGLCAGLTRSFSPLLRLGPPRSCAVAPPGNARSASRPWAACGPGSDAERPMSLRSTATRLCIQGHPSNPAA
jgi:hypothetical protein